MKTKHYDSRWRSIFKALSWKFFASFLTLGITYYFTGEVGEALEVAVAVFFLGLLLFYIHERVWNHIHWGKSSKYKSHHLD